MRVTIHSKWVDPDEYRSWSGDVPGETLNGKNDLSDEEICEILFRLFNRVDSSDVHRLRDWEYDLPSMSEGDEVTFRRRWYQRKQTWRVLGIGWKLVKRSWL